MPNLRLVNVVKEYGRHRAVDGLSLDVPEGELLTLLGPSGCGKTTTLRAISGFVQLDGGHIYLGDREITSIPAERRGIGLVFQNYALWPHMSVFQNLAFGLQLKRLPKEEINRKVEAALAMVKLDGYEERYPRQLSGGQQQRVALARAVVLEPDILLLDEPLSNLDAILREQMRFEIAQIHKQLGITAIYVTHDQTEAMVMSDRIALLNEGRIVQLGKPAEVYSRPANKFVAGFMGTTSFIHGTVERVEGNSVTLVTERGMRILGRGSGLAVGQAADAAVRPEIIEFRTEPAGIGDDARNLFAARVARATYVGELIDYQLEIGGTLLRAKSKVTEGLPEGHETAVHLDPSLLAILPA